MQQHIHARKVVSGDVFFLAVDFSNAVITKLIAHIKQQRARTAGKIKNTFQMFLFPKTRILTIKRHNLGKNGRNLLRRIKLASFFARTRRKLTNQIFISIAQSVFFRRKMR